MAQRACCGYALADTFVDNRAVPSPVYLTTANGSGASLQPYTSAAALLEHVTALHSETVVDDLAGGFTWAVQDAVPKQRVGSAYGKHVGHAGQSPLRGQPQHCGCLLVDGPDTDHRPALASLTNRSRGTAWSR